jgi:hypothetical protein
MSSQAHLGAGSDDIFHQLHEEPTEYGGKTEWEDILIKQGIKQAPPAEPLTDDVIQLHMQDAIKHVKQQQLNDATLSDLSDLEDDLEDPVLRQYRERRLNQMAANAALAKHGSVQHISEADFVREVTESSAQGKLVIVHLYHPGTTPCQLVSEACQQLARRHPTIKFVRIVAREAIHNFPDNRCPTLLCYSSGAIVAQLSTLSEMGGDRTSADSIEWRLSKLRHNLPKSTNSAHLSSAPNTKTSALDDDDAISDETSKSVPLLITKLRSDPAIKPMKMARQTKSSAAARNLRRDNSSSDEEDEED